MNYTTNSKKSNYRQRLIRKVVDNRPPLVIISPELTSNTPQAAVIRLREILIDANGAKQYSEYLFNNNDQAITPEATQHHGITMEMLRNKPVFSASSYDLEKAIHIVVWDGRVFKTILYNHNILNHSKIINVHSLARYLEFTPKPMSMKKCAEKYLSHKKFTIGIELKNSKNKVTILNELLDSLRMAYQAKYDIGSDLFLQVSGRQKTKKDQGVAIEKFLSKKSFLNKFKSNVGPAELPDPKKIIITITEEKKPKKKYTPRVNKLKQKKGKK